MNGRKKKITQVKQAPILLTITKATVSDIPVIRTIAEAVWPKAYGAILSPAQLRYMLDLFYSESALAAQFHKHQFVTAREDGTVIGFASYEAIGENMFKLHKLYVLSGIQSRGVGRQIIGTIINDIRPLGAQTLFLNVNKHNSAKLFYEKLGFKVIKEEDIDIGNGYWMNDFVMRLDVGM